ncbi:hypothetical protein GCM10023206_02460 [Acinetobacter puyangensis]
MYEVLDGSTILVTCTYQYLGRISSGCYTGETVWYDIVKQDYAKLGETSLVYDMYKLSYSMSK